jgi:hypothetical protein
MFDITRLQEQTIKQTNVYIRKILSYRFQILQHVWFFRCGGGIRLFSYENWIENFNLCIILVIFYN